MLPMLSRTPERSAYAFMRAYPWAGRPSARSANSTYLSMAADLAASAQLRQFKIRKEPADGSRIYIYRTGPLRLVDFECIRGDESRPRLGLRVACREQQPATA